jgi:hypothetical protein
MIIQNSRHLLKRTKTALEVPTIPTGSTVHTDGTWTSANIYPGELFLNMEDKKLYIGVEDISGNTDVVLLNPFADSFGLPETLAADNTTGGNNIIVTNGDLIKNSTNEINIEINSTGMKINAPGGLNQFYIDPNLLPAYADDADAGTNGLSPGQIFQTDGTGAAPLNVAGILMVKQ